MTELSNTHKKNILSDPVTLFTKACPDAIKNQTAALTRLHQQYIELNKQYKAIQIQCKKISRQIGEAKRERLTTDKLMQAMQQRNADLNNLKNQLNDISDNILSYFNSKNDADNTTRQLPASLVRAHTDLTDIPYDQISITLLSDENDAWNHYVESNPAASIYHHAKWKDLIHNVFGHQCYYFYASDNNGEIIGILPLVRLKSRLFGDFMVSMPYFNSGGAIANSLNIEQKLIQTANKHAESIDVNHIEYRDDIARDGLAVRTEKVNMILSLPDTQNDLWQTFTSKLRSQIRRSQREETQVSFGGAECLEDFYTVFAQNMRDLGTPVYGKSFFRKILEEFAQHSKIVVIRKGKRPVAAAFLLGYKDTLEIPWASTIKTVNHLSTNMLLYWEVLQFAIENHYRYFDFGRSSKDSGTFRFKQQWGAKPKQMYWHYWLPTNVKLPELNPTNPKFALAINIWKLLPIGVTNWLGPYIVRNLP